MEASEFSEIFLYHKKGKFLKPSSGNLKILYEPGKVGYNATHNLHTSF